MKNQLFRYPTPEEMVALHAAARRDRARCMNVLFRIGVRALKYALKSLAARFAALPVGKRVSHA